jgi:hypothetical protein
MSRQMTKAQRAAADVEAEARKNGPDGQSQQSAPEDTTPARDLNDPAVQETIVNPVPAEVTIGKAPVKLYPFAAKPSREFRDFLTRLFTLAGADDPERKAPFSGRLVLILGNNKAFAPEFYTWVARAEHEPGTKLDADAIAQRVGEIDESLWDTEVGRLFDALCAVNRIFEGMTASPKSPPTSGAPATT